MKAAEPNRGTGSLNDSPTSDQSASAPKAIDVDLDVRGLNCPMPLLKAKLALNGMSSGEVLRVTATDPGSERDFDVFSDQSGHALLSSSKAGGEFVYVLRRK